MMSKNSPGKDQTSVDQNNSVYGELKLSEKLQIEIYAMKEERDQLYEQVEMLLSNNADLNKLVKDHSHKTFVANSQLKQLQDRLAKVTQDNTALTIQLQDMTSQKDCAMNLVSQSEAQRKEFSQQLQNEKVKNERQSNYITDLKQKIQIKLMETDIMGDQLKSLFDAIDSLGHSKKQND